jgi:formylglycine-generating enzyme
MSWDWLLTDVAPTGDVQRYVDAAETLQEQGNLRLAATAYDHAYGLAPIDDSIRNARQALLDALSITEHGLTFRYIPAGTFLMGSSNGDPDEQPIHPVQLDEFWMADVPMDWTTYCRLMGWRPPPIGAPHDVTEKLRASLPDDKFWNWSLNQSRKMRLQYCEDETLRAYDWHSHTQGDQWLDGKGNPVPNPFPSAPRSDADAPLRYAEKPMIAVSWGETQLLCERLSTATVQCRVPTEAQWEKAARGGLIRRRYAWGDDPPDANKCDFDRFQQFSILPARTFAPNGYGLYAMCGGVWEWTADWYDADYYSTGAMRNPTGAVEGQSKVWRGGSWADCAEAVTTSYRMATPFKPEYWVFGGSPIVGFRVCRVETSS